MAVNRLLPSFHAWAEARPDLEPDVADTIVDLKSTHLRDPRPGRWRTGDLETVLLDLVPKHVIADDDWYARAIPTVRAFLRHARTEGLLHKGSAPLFVLMQELDAVEHQFHETVRDSSRSGTARPILSSGGAAPVDFMAVLQKVDDEFNGLMSGEAASGWDDDDYRDDGYLDDDDLDDDDLEALTDTDLDRRSREALLEAAFQQVVEQFRPPSPSSVRLMRAHLTTEDAVRVIEGQGIHRAAAIQRSGSSRLRNAPPTRPAGSTSPPDRGLGRRADPGPDP